MSIKSCKVSLCSNCFPLVWSHVEVCSVNIKFLGNLEVLTAKTLKYTIKYKECCICESCTVGSTGVKKMQYTVM